MSVLLLFLLQNETYPASYSAILMAVDGLDEYDTISRLALRITDRQNADIVLKLSPLPFRRIWNVTVFAYNCKEHQLTESFELGQMNENFTC